MSSALIKLPPEFVLGVFVDSMRHGEVDSGCYVLHFKTADRNTLFAFTPESTPHDTLEKLVHIFSERYNTDDIALMALPPAIWAEGMALMGQH